MKTLIIIADSDSANLGKTITQLPPSFRLECGCNDKDYMEVKIIVSNKAVKTITFPMGDIFLDLPDTVLTQKRRELYSYLINIITNDFTKFIATPICKKGQPKDLYSSMFFDFDKFYDKWCESIDRREDKLVWDYNDNKEK